MKIEQEDVREGKRKTGSYLRASRGGGHKLRGCWPRTEGCDERSAHHASTGGASQHIRGVLSIFRHPQRYSVRIRGHGIGGGGYSCFMCRSSIGRNGGTRGGEGEGFHGNVTFISESEIDR